jgi:hypothetical protein
MNNFNTPDEQLRARPDFAERVHWILLGYSALAWAIFLLAWIPLDGLVDGWRAACFSSALVMSWITVGASLWSSIRVRRRGCYWAVAASLPLAMLCGAILTWLLFGVESL